MSILQKIRDKFTVTQTVYLPHPQVVMSEPKGGGRELPPHDSKGMVKLGLVVGHERKAPGALMIAPYRIYEYAFNQQVAQMAAQYAKDKYPNVIVEIFYRDNIGIAGAYQSAIQAHCDCVIELHFNAANGQATGTETLCTTDAGDVEFAHILHTSICQLFQRPGTSRGVKCLSKADRGNINVHSFPGGANCLVEPFFGDQLNDAKHAMENREGYAKCLIEAVVLWAKKVDLIHG